MPEALKTELVPMQALAMALQQIMVTAAAAAAAGMVVVLDNPHPLTPTHMVVEADRVILTQY